MTSNFHFLGVLICIFLTINSQPFIFPTNNSEIKLLHDVNSSYKSNSSISNKSNYLINYPLPIDLEPHDLLIDDDGSIWFTVQSNNSLWNYDTKEKKLTNYTLPLNITPLLIKQTSHDMFWFSDNEIQVQEGGQYIGSFNLTSHEFNLIKLDNLSVGPYIMGFDEKHLWITDYQGSNLVEITFDGTKNQREIEIECPYSYCSTNGIVVKENDIWINDGFNQDLIRYNRITNEIRRIQYPNIYWGPIDLEISDNGLLWSGAHSTDMIASYNITANEFTLYHSRNEPDVYVTSGMNDIDIDKQNNIWFSEHFINYIGKLQVDTKSIIEYRIANNQPLIQWISIDKENNIWIANQKNKMISMINTSLAPIIDIKPKFNTNIENYELNTPFQYTAKYRQGNQSSLRLTPLIQLPKLSNIEITYKITKHVVNLGEEIEYQFSVISAKPGRYTIIFGVEAEGLSAVQHVTIVINTSKIQVNLIIIIGVSIFVAVPVLIFLRKYFSKRKVIVN